MDQGANQTHADAISGAARWRKFGSAGFFGIVAGLVVSGFDLLTRAYGGGIEDFFKIFDSPVILLTRAAREQFDFLAEINPRLYNVYSFIAVICYWAVIGFLLAKLFCLRRAGRRRKAEIGVAGE